MDGEESEQFHFRLDSKLRALPSHRGRERRARRAQKTMSNANVFFEDTWANPVALLTEAGHRYFSTEKFRDPTSRRRAPVLKCYLTRISAPFGF